MPIRLQIHNMPRRMIVPSLAIFLLTLPGNVFAQEGPSLELVIDEAVKNNPEILAAKRAYEAANARIWQAASLADPIFEMEYNRMIADRDLSGEPMKSFAISQDVPFPTKLYFRARIAAKMARMAYENYQAKTRDVIARVKAAYAELFIIHKSIQIMMENKNILSKFSELAVTRYSTGASGQEDALKAQIELAKVDNELVMLEQKKITSQARLNVLLNRDPGEEMGMPAAEGPVTFKRPVDAFYKMAKENNPELKAYGYAIDRGRAAYRLAINEFAPDFMVKYSQMVDGGEPQGGMWAGMVGVTVPLWFVQKQAFGVKEMKAELAMAEAEYKMKENMVLLDIRDSYARADANKKIVELYETSFLPQANETVKAALRSYEAGKTDFLTLLDSQRMQIEFKLDHYKSILELRMALADLERSVGTDVDFSKE